MPVKQMFNVSTDACFISEEIDNAIGVSVATRLFICAGNKAQTFQLLFLYPFSFEFDSPKFCKCECIIV